MKAVQGGQVHLIRLTGVAAVSLARQPSPSWPLSQVGLMEMPDLPLDFVESMVKLADKTGQRMSQTNEKELEGGEGGH